MIVKIVTKENVRELFRMSADSPLGPVFSNAGQCWWLSGALKTEKIS